MVKTDKNCSPWTHNRQKMCITIISLYICLIFLPRHSAHGFSFQSILGAPILGPQDGNSLVGWLSRLETYLGLDQWWPVGFTTQIGSVFNDLHVLLRQFLYVVRYKYRVGIQYMCILCNIYPRKWPHL